MINTIHRINHYPLDSAIGFAITYPLDSDSGLVESDGIVRVLKGLSRYINPVLKMVGISVMKQR